MEQIKFFQQVGGRIEFEFDTEKFYGVSQHGTSVPLWEEELVFVPKRKCKCNNPSCQAQETSFGEKEVVKCIVPPEITSCDTQPYTGKYSCWVSVQLYDQEKVDADCPHGFVPCVSTLEHGVYHCHEFLWQ